MPGFSKSSKILKTSEFSHLIKCGRYFGNRYFGIRFEKKEKRRLGIAVSKKTGTAVRRNRIKRVIREFFRLHAEKFPQGDLIVIAREGASALSNKAVCDSLAELLCSRKFY